MSTILALIANLLLVNWRSDVRFNLNTLIPIVFYSTVGALVILSFVFATKPEIVDKLVHDIEDIQNYQSQGTGEWRYRQYLSYQPFIEENLLTGMRFQGFELPIQFYEHWDENTDRPYFNDNTGHHIHSNYIDTLFYFGIAGLFIFYVPAFFYFFFQIRKKKMLNIDQVVLISFCATIFAYSYSYTWPIWAYTTVGMLAVLLEKNENSLGEEVVDSEEKKYHQGRGHVPAAV
jgi:O-antigen ligase